MFLHTWQPTPIIFTIGHWSVRWYGLLLAVAVIAAIFVAYRLAKREQFNLDHLFNSATWIIISGFIGARLYHVSNEWNYYTDHWNEIYQVWHGGLAIHGALIGGLIAIIICAWRMRYDAWKFIDLLAPGLVLAQAIGRWGNYFNQELFGRPTNQPWGIPINLLLRPGDYQNSPYFHPTFLYESLGCLIIFGALIGLFYLRHKYPGRLRWININGNIASAYLILYSLLRIVTETFRIDQTPVIGDLRLPIITSVVIIIAAGISMLIRYRQYHVHGSTT